MEPDHIELKKKAETLIAEQTTMTLATTGNGNAWAAPVYYVYLARRKPGFFFFSNPTARHIRESLAGCGAAAAIFEAAATWQGIRGIQMSGTIAPVSIGMEAINALKGYLKKYPFTGDFFPPGEAMDLKAFSDRFHVKFYRFSPSLIYYGDNSIRFGFRETVEL